MRDFFSAFCPSNATGSDYGGTAAPPLFFSSVLVFILQWLSTGEVQDLGFGCRAGPAGSESLLGAWLPIQSGQSCVSLCRTFREWILLRLSISASHVEPVVISGSNSTKSLLLSFNVFFVASQRRARSFSLAGCFGLRAVSLTAKQLLRPAR